MALNEISKENLDKENIDGILLHLNNGDLEILKKIKEDWKFKDNSSVLRYLLAVIKQAENNIIYIINKDGEKIGLTPSESLLKPKLESGE